MTLGLGAEPAAAARKPAGAATAGSKTTAAAPKKSADWKDIAWHSTAAMLGAGVISLPLVLACLGYAGGVALLLLAIFVSRDTYMCLVRCYEVDGDLFFERRWRHRRERAAARLRRAALVRKLSPAPSGGVVVAATDNDKSNNAATAAAAKNLSRAQSAGGPGGAEDFDGVGEDEHDTDAIETVRDAVMLVCAETGAPLDIAEAEKDYCRRRGAARRARRAAADEGGDALETGGAVVAKLEPPSQRTVALFHEYSALTRWAFGRKLGTMLLTPFQTALIVGICISYNIVGAEALYSIVASVRAMIAASSSAAISLAPYPKTPFYITFAAVQGFLAVACGSIAESGAVSLGGVLASVVYCGIASGLSLAIVAWRNAAAAAGSPFPPLSHNPADALYDPAGPATGPGAPGGPTLGAAFAALNALAVLLFSYGGHNISLETNAVLPVPPPSTLPAMRKGVNVAFLITAVACFWTALTGYAAFGSSVGDNILTTISDAALGGASSVALGGGKAGGVSAASLLAVRVAISVAQFAIFAHVLAAYNVYAQTLWVSSERRLTRRWREFRGVDPTAAPRRSAVPPALAAALARAPLRLVYVVAVLAVSVAVPFFGPVAGIVGAFCVTPTTFVLPYALEVVRHQEFDRTDDGDTRARSTLPLWRRAACWVGGVGASAVGLAGTAASVYIIVAQLGAKGAHH